jgi:hypothetical protein
MRAITKHRPTPALVIAILALVTSLSGVGVAAARLPAQGVHASHAASSKPLTKTQIQKLIASYVKKHRASLRGPKGNTGKTGKTGKTGNTGNTGKQGPGAIAFSSSDTSTLTQPVTLGTYGLWTVTLDCAPNPPNATVTVTGPGTYTETIFFSSSEGGMAVGNVYPTQEIGSGATASIDDDAQQTVTEILQSGSTVMAMTFDMATSSNGTELCPVHGYALPLS